MVLCLAFFPSPRGADALRLSFGLCVASSGRVSTMLVVLGEVGVGISSRTQPTFPGIYTVCWPLSGAAMCFVGRAVARTNAVARWS